MLFHIYLFVLLAGIGIGSVEYIRWCERSLPTSADIPPEIALTFDDGPHPVYTKKIKLKMWILPLKSRMKICTKREDGFIFEEY